MAYVPNATTVTEPIESRSVESAALEFRTLKEKVVADSSRVAALEAALTILGQEYENIGGTPVGEGSNPIYQLFSGDGSTTTFTLLNPPGSLASLEVFISGVRQRPWLDYTWSSGTTLTFTSAPPVGANNIFALWGNTLTVNTPSDGSISTAKIANGAVTLTKLANSGYELGMRNRIINGGMAIWQRGTSFSTMSYTADRWFSYMTTGSVSTARSTDTPTGAGFAYSLSITGTGAGLRHPIESANTVDLVGNSITVSFWMKQTVGAGAGSMVVWLDYANAKDNFGAMIAISSVAITPTATWAKYTATFNNLPAGAANGLMLFFEPASFLAANTLFITGVQLEKGSTATPFEFRPYSVELAMCQRYYQTGYQIVDSYTAAGGAVAVTLPFPVTPRVTPTITPTAAGTNINHGAISASTVSANNFPYGALIWANATATGAVRIESSFTISAEL